MSDRPRFRRPDGAGRVLVAAYALLALSATGRSTYQIIAQWSEAPWAYSLSAVAAVIYIVATIALCIEGPRARRIAIVAISIELAGVLTVGVASIIASDHFPDATVWSDFGVGYGFVPLVLPVLGLLWLRRTGRSDPDPVRSAA
ncbi:MAG: hypothetical protein AB7V42_15425 [Thermoleophilia bacterium]